MGTTTQWQGQDILNLTEEQWLEILQDGNIVNSMILKMIDFVYKKPNHTSTASEIAHHFNVHYNQVTAWNRHLSKQLYHKCSKEPPRNSDGKGYRYWNIIFDGIPENPKDSNGHFYWKLRPNLVKAWEKFTEDNRNHL
ncbi:MAG TPA: hypothetical protein H9662_05505 [Firmicutes bacterium]|nr:hypothetical protein [Bacillota bacterium]